jgi:hypothetical protein
MIESSGPALRVDLVAAIAIDGKALDGMTWRDSCLKLVLMARDACERSSGVSMARGSRMTTFARRGCMSAYERKTCLLVPLLHVCDKPGFRRVTTDAAGPELLLVRVGVA